MIGIGVARRRGRGRRRRRGDAPPAHRGGARVSRRRGSMALTAPDPDRRRGRRRGEHRRRRHGYARYAGAKVAGALGSLAFMLVVNFFLFRVLPGDPARTLGRGRLTHAGAAGGVQQALRAQRAAGAAVRDLHQEHAPRRPRDLPALPRAGLGLILDRMWPTLLLVGTSTVLAAVIGVWMGIRSAWDRGATFDRFSTGVVPDAVLHAGVVARPGADRGVRGRDGTAARPLPDRLPALPGRGPGPRSRACSTRSGTSPCRWSP